MVTDDGEFSYESDVLWLVEQARPYYYSIILILIYFEFYTLALTYAIAALSLIWEVDEVDRIEEDFWIDKRRLSTAGVHRIVDVEIMLDYLENVVEDELFPNNDPLFIEYFNHLDSYFILDNLPNLFIFEETRLQIYTTFDKQKIVKMDDKIDKAVNYREWNSDVLKEKLMEFKVKTITTSNPAVKKLVQARMKKLLELADKFEYDLLVYKISVESHNTVMLGLYLQMGLYPISEYDFDLVAFDNQDSIVYTEYLFYYFFSSSNLVFLNSGYDPDVDDLDDLDIDESSPYLSDLNPESKSDFSNL